MNHTFEHGISQMCSTKLIDELGEATILELIRSAGQVPDSAKVTTSWWKLIDANPDDSNDVGGRIPVATREEANLVEYSFHWMDGEQE